MFSLDSSLEEENIEFCTVDYVINYQENDGITDAAKCQLYSIDRFDSLRVYVFQFVEAWVVYRVLTCT